MARGTGRIRLEPSTQVPTARAGSSLPGGWWLWCLAGLGLGLSVWIGGRIYLKQQLTARLAETETVIEARQIIRSLLKLDGDAAGDIAAALGHREYLVADSAYRALDEQIDAWAELSVEERVRRMKLLANQLDNIPTDLSPNHKMLVHNLAGRLYADAMSCNAEGSADVLDICKRIVSRALLNPATDSGSGIGSTAFAGKPNNSAVTAALNTLSDLNSGEGSVASELSGSPVPPPLPPLDASQFTDASSVSQPLAIVGLTKISDQENTDQEGTVQQNSEDLPPVESADTDTSPVVVNNLRKRSAMGIGGGRATVHLTASTPAAMAASPSDEATTTMTPIVLSDDEQPTIVPPSTIREPRFHSLSDNDPSTAAGVTGATSSRTLSDSPERPLSVADAQTIAGIDQLPIDRLVRLLASVQPRVAQAAALALRAKGLPEDKLELAMQFANGDEADRLARLEETAVRTDLDPRPWLVWMAEAGETSVRRKAVSLLSTMVDEDVRRGLRMQLNRERDEEIAQMIRRVLVDPAR